MFMLCVYFLYFSICCHYGEQESQLSLTNRASAGAVYVTLNDLE